MALRSLTTESTEDVNSDTNENDNIYHWWWC